MSINLIFAFTQFILHIMDKRLEELQTELVKFASSKADYGEVADEIHLLRDEKQKTYCKCANRDELLKRIDDMSTFLREQPAAITEFDEWLVRRLIKKVTIYENKFTVGFKSGVSCNMGKTLYLIGVGVLLLVLNIMGSLVYLKGTSK